MISYMGIITVVYVATFFILTIILLVSIVVLKNERKINRVSEQFNGEKLAKIQDKNNENKN